MGNEQYEKRKKIIDMVCGLYNTRNYTIPALAKELCMSVGDVKRVLTENNYQHTIKRTPQNKLKNRNINMVLLLDDMEFLDQYYEERCLNKKDSKWF